MARPVFYHGTIKRLIVAFSTIFDDIRYINDYGVEIHVPLHYAPKEKFISYIQEKGNLPEPALETVLPRMGFEMFPPNYAPERMTNPLNKIRSRISDDTFSFNRIPYDFTFALYAATKKFEESLQIIEQIAPFFTPELNLSIRDREDLDLITDVPVTLNSTSFSIEYEGGFESKRYIQWELQFTLKAWLYGDDKRQAVIKKAITELRGKDYEQRFTKFVSEVDPLTASSKDEFVIKDSIE